MENEELMLRELVMEVELGTLNENTARFIKSLAEFKKQSGKLTDKQSKTLEKIFNETFR